MTPDKPSLKSLIIEELHDVYLLDRKRWVMRRDMEKRPNLIRYSGHTVTRRCQELAEDGIIYRHEEKRGRTSYAFYRYKPQRTIVWKKGELTRSKKTRA